MGTAGRSANVITSLLPSPRRSYRGRLDTMTEANDWNQKIID
jgi:hypothetical protein